MGSKVLALSGGVGGAKLALGLARTLAPGQLTVVANTADDFEHLGLYIAPDLDTVMYTLAGLSDPVRGWGIEDESWTCLEALGRLGGEDWFRLGDRDLATHLRRSQLLAAGGTLSSVTAELCARLGIEQRLLPMSDDPVRTIVHTEDGDMPFQRYFVREQCRPRVRRFHFDGIDAASAQPEFLAQLADPDLQAIVICPSNPFVSVDPILGLPGVRRALLDSAAPIVAVSPIVAGAALKGPAAKMLSELGQAVSALAVAEHYAGLVDLFVLDQRDATLAEDISALGMSVQVTPTVMQSIQDRERLASSVLARVAGFR